MKRILLCFLLFLTGCGSSKPILGRYSIGRDPTWFPLRLEEMTVNINGFTNALVQEIAKVEKHDFNVINVGWNQLFEGLEEGDYAGIFSVLAPTVITREKYSFSDPYLLLGPVLVVPHTSKAESLADLKGKTVGVYQFDDSVLIVQRHPSIVIKLYQNISQALEDIIDGKMEGALIPNLEARALISNLYSDRLKIVTAPLSDKGLRLLTLKGQQEKLIKHFNEGLEKLTEESIYSELRLNFLGRNSR